MGFFDLANGRYKLTTLTTLRFSSGRGTKAEIPLHNDTVSTQKTAPTIRCISGPGLKKDATKECSKPKENASVFKPNLGPVSIGQTKVQIDLVRNLQCCWKKSTRQPDFVYESKLSLIRSFGAAILKPTLCKYYIDVWSVVCHVTWQNRLLRGRNEGMTGARLDEHPTRFSTGEHHC